MEETLWLEAMDKLYRVGGAAFVLKMLDSFLGQMEERRSGAERALDQGDVETATRIFHSYKSSAGLLGARRLQTILQDLESRMTERDVDGTRARLPELDDCLRDTREALQSQRNRVEKELAERPAS